jgi:eukaryotic-like serine/threonine-protein kinase
MMDATRWQRVEEIFHTVVDIPPGAAREEKLSSLCPEDDTLAAEVRELLAEDDRLTAQAASADPHLGLRLGSYQVDALVARGGMAAVYKAHRADDQFHQQVAIKIMDLRLSDPALVTQFRAERQILAAFEHPTLTRLLDGGVTGLGEPYLVMEYVEGQPIDRYCDAQRLDLAARVRLFVQVCAGVAFAHRNLVLHRDLKPSNILVTSDGHPKVVDFGTATLLQPDRLATMSRAPLTPAYASPEQLTGGAVGTASDQYSLGLVLYELVTGVVPFAARASLMAAVERALAGTEPTAPDEAVSDDAAEQRRMSPGRLRKQLAGDLGTIVRKALAADATARYASVQHLSDDLERWARNEPILGRAPSLAYRTTRFAQRHRVAVAVATTLLISLIAATVVSFRQAAIARAESGKATQLNKFLTQMLWSANPTWRNANAANAGSVTVREVLDSAAELIGPELSDTPEVEAEMRLTLGGTYIGMGAVDKARPHLERALTLFRAQNDDLGTLRTLGAIGNELMHRGEFKGSEQALREAMELVRSQGEDTLDPIFRAGVRADLAAAIAYQHPGHEEALALMREAIAIDDRHGLTVQSAQVLQNLSIQLIRLGRLDEGEVAVRDALRRWDAVPSPPPERNTALRTLAVLLFQKGEYAEAERLAAAAAESYARLMPTDHPLQANIRIWWGRFLLAAGDVEKGRDVVQDAVARYRKMRPPGHLEMALPLITLGILQRADGQLADAEASIRDARAILAKNPSSKDRAADAAGELGLTLRAMGRKDESEALLKESHAMLQSLYGDGHPLTKQALGRIKGD